MFAKIVSFIATRWYFWAALIGSHPFFITGSTLAAAFWSLIALILWAYIMTRNQNNTAHSYGSVLPVWRFIFYCIKQPLIWCVLIVLLLFFPHTPIRTILFISWLAYSVYYFHIYRKDKKKMEPVSKDKLLFYQSKGLSKQDVTFFRETMATAKNRIVRIENNFSVSSKLAAVETRNNTVAVLKDFFHEIVQQPQRLHEVDKFLYTSLVQLETLTTQYLEISTHVVKTKEMYRSLSQSAETIDALCQQINQQYVIFRSKDMDELSVTQQEVHTSQQF